MVAPGPARSTRRLPRMSGLIEEFVPRDKLSRLGGRAQSIEYHRIDSFEAKLVGDAGEKNLLAPGIEHLDRRAADPVPAGRHGATGDERLTARDEQRSGRRRRPWHGAARDFEFFRQSAEKGESRRKTIHIDTVARAEVQADDAPWRQIEKRRDLGDVLAM